MNQEDRSLEDCDGPIASFRGATLRIQQDNTCDDFAVLPLTGNVHTSGIPTVSRSGGNSVSSSEMNSGPIIVWASCLLYAL